MNDIMNEVRKVEVELNTWVDEMIGHLRKANDDAEVVGSMCRFLSLRAMDPLEAIGMAGTLSVAVYTLAKQKMEADGD
jgi:hypothetical protein